MSTHSSADSRGRICFFVFDTGAGWAVEFDSQQPLAYFPTRAIALQAARDAANARWTVQGIPSCTRLGRPNETTMLDRDYG